MVKEAVSTGIEQISLGFTKIAKLIAYFDDCFSGLPQFVIPVYSI